MADRDLVHIRRVGFRNGTDEELGALHAVESVVEAERRPDRVPQPLDSYIKFARNLPAQFEDHTWVAGTNRGVPVATGACWSNSSGDPRVMECDLFVLPRYRRRGIGIRLLTLICESCEAEERSLLTWSTFDAVPAGDEFSKALGASVARVNRTSDLVLEKLDWTMVRAWIEQATQRAAGYQLVWNDGPWPVERRADAARFHHIMQTAPRDDLAVGDVHLTEGDVADHDRALVEAGRERWTALVLAPDGACVGGTEVTFEPWEPETVLQQNTGIDPSHRGRGLAKWVKAAMLERIRDERPAATRVRTGNAFSNAAMLAINDALGFVVISTRTEWQLDVGLLRAALAARINDVRVDDLDHGDLSELGWSGSASHLRNVAGQLGRRDVGAVDYLVVRDTATGAPVCKGAIDYEEFPGAGTIIQVATRADLQGRGYARRLLGEAERRVAARGVAKARLAVEPDNVRARALYESLGYESVGSRKGGWEYDGPNGERLFYETTLVDLEKTLP